MEEFLNTLPSYVEGQELANDEFLFKKKYNGMAFLSKLTKKGAPHANFLKWESKEKIYVFKEDFSTGWEFVSFRGGESQNWAILKHPKGFHLEIYLTNFKEIIKTHVISNGEIKGMFKWEDSKLIEHK